MVVSFATFKGKIKDGKYVHFNYPHYDMATYLMVDGEKVAPITEYLDVDSFLDTIETASF